MKKAFALTLALVMCLSLIPLRLTTLTATAYGNEYIQLEKSNFGLDEKIVVTFLNVPAGASYDINKKDRSGSVAWGGVSEGTSSGTHTFREVGEYTVNLYRNKNYTDLIASVTFTVGMTAKNGSISLDKTEYAAFEQITISFSGITQEMINSRAIVSMYKKDAKHDDYIEYRQITLDSGAEQMFARNENGEYEMRLYSVFGVNNDETFVMSVPFTVSGAITTSPWAVDQKVAEKASEYGLVPDNLKGADWTKPITRAEFAAVAVKLYENLTGKKASPIEKNPFADTKDAEILKAYSLGVTNGTGATLFSPNDFITREQLATMLTRALKTAYIPGWTLVEDSQFTRNFAMPAKFADDDKISEYAKESVYFMAANGIVNGVGGNRFAPKNTTDTEVALGYANATREQALVIAVRMVENLKDKPLDYSQKK